MPGSMPEGKEFIKEFLLTKDIKTILDVGPGSGNYYDLLSPHIAVKWTAVEIWSPYFEYFHLKNKYSTFINADIYDLDWESLTESKFDVIILGDVIEHMTRERADKVIKDCINHATWVVLSLPIIDYPQGPSYGNVHETHVEQYSPEKVAALLKDCTIVAQQEGEVIGAYIFHA